MLILGSVFQCDNLFHVHVVTFFLEGLTWQMGSALKWASSSHVRGKGEIWETVSFFYFFPGFV